MGLHARTRSRLSGVALLVALVAGCGGGGGGGDVPVDPPSAPPPPAGPPAPLPALKFGEFPSAAVVIGQPDFDEGDTPPEPAMPTDLNFPSGNPAVTADGRLLVVEAGLDQVKVFPNFDATPTGASADPILGLSSPRSFSMQGDRLVAVTGSMVHIYNTAPTAEVAPDVTEGDALPDCAEDRLSNASGAYLTPLGQLVVADTNNNRVLIWTTVPTSGTLGPADVVLGQARMDTCVANDELGDGIRDPEASARTLHGPRSVWSDGVRLVVADTKNSRVLIWDKLPTTRGEFQAPADHVLGQINFVNEAENAGQGQPSSTSLAQPYAVDVNDRGQLAVVDNSNNRVLIWDSIPTADSVRADQVIGQPDFETGTSDINAQSLDNPLGVRFHNRNLIVVDAGNNRVVVWRATN